MSRHSGLKVQVGREPGPSIDIAALRQFLENDGGENYADMLFQDTRGDYFIPQNVGEDGAVEGVVFSPDPEVVFPYSYGPQNGQRFRRVNEPVTITLTFNQ
jgi:hypothetical protein